MTKDDLEFLKDFQHELKTQNNEGNAEPVFWSIMETEKVYDPEGDISYFDIDYDGEPYDMEGFADYINNIMEESIDQDLRELWVDTDKTDYYELTDFADRLNIHYDVTSYSEEERIAWSPGAFLTKRAIVNYIEDNKHNYNNPKPFSASACKNKELAKFLDIFKNMDLDTLKIDE